MTINVFYDDIEVGQEIPAFVRETSFPNWNRFAAVNDEFIPIHMDDDAARAMGQDAAFGMGNLRWAYLLNALRDWAGDEAEIRELTVQFRATNKKNDVLTTRGVVAEKRQEGEDNLVVLDVDVVNQNDEKTTPGRAVLVLPARA